MGPFRRPVRGERTADTNFSSRKGKRPWGLRKFVSPHPLTHPPRARARTALTSNERIEERDQPTGRSARKGTPSRLPRLHSSFLINTAPLPQAHSAGEWP